MKNCLLALLAIVVLAAPAAAQRLPANAVPEHYTLWFAPDLKKETFRGRETIRIQLKAPAKSVTLNAAEIEFGEVTIASGGRTQQAQVTADEKAEMATLTVPQQMPAGPATIQITYTGILNDKLRGFYISKANNRSYAVTQMEATDARRAFPSFDEPAYKATFDITLMIDTGDSAISNGRQLSDSPGPEPGKHTVTFAPTAKMSSYLVAMVVGDFVCREGAADGIPVRVCSTPDKRALTAFALEAAEQEVKFFNQYFGIKYPFGKLDIIGVPDFAAGAMENAGAITFRERVLLADPQTASLGVRKNIAAVISHELAHQWFGDLVTMKWWDDIWLNEGFATWMANKPLAQWKPEWRVELDDTQETQTALTLDSLRSTRAIRTKAETPEEINELFDPIAYEKTAAVLRMIEGFVGPDSFRKAIESYLKKYSFSNANGEDFWTEMTRVTGKPVDRIMKTFVEQPGAPTLNVFASSNGGKTDVKVAQDRFVGAPGASAPAPQTWTLPACFKTSSGEPSCQLIERREQTLTVPSGNNVFANAEGRGYYVTDYGPAGVRALTKNAASLKASERISLLGDEWWMVRGGRHDVDVYLDLAAALASDDTPAVADTLAARLTFTGNYLVDPSERSKFQSWLRAKFGPSLDTLGFPGNRADDDQKQSRRADLVALLGVVGGDQDIQRRARELAEKYIADPTSLSPTLASTVLQVAATSGDRALYDAYVAQIEKLAGKPEEYYRFFNALSAFRDPALVKRTLDFSITPAVRSQDTGQLIAGVIGRPSSQDAGWEFTKAQWDTLTKKLGTFQGIPTIIGALGGFCSEGKANEVKQFFAAHPVPSSERTLQQTVERIENCAAVKARQGPALTKWLASAR